MYYESKRKGVKIMIAETGEVFDSIAECANHLGVNYSWLGKVSRGNDNLHTCHGMHILRVDDPRSNYDVSRKEYRGRKGTKVRVVETGEVYDSISDCANSIKGSSGTIYDILNGKRNRHTHKGLHFEYTD